MQIYFLFSVVYIKQSISLKFQENLIFDVFLLPIFVSFVVETAYICGAIGFNGSVWQTKEIETHKNHL